MAILLELLSLGIVSVGDLLLLSLIERLEIDRSENDRLESGPGDGVGNDLAVFCRLLKLDPEAMLAGIRKAVADADAAPGE